MCDLENFWGNRLSGAPFFLFLGQETGGVGVLAVSPFLEHKQRGPLTREGQTSPISDLLSQTSLSDYFLL